MEGCLLVVSWGGGGGIEGRTCIGSLRLRWRGDGVRVQSRFCIVETSFEVCNFFLQSGLVVVW